MWYHEVFAVLTWMRDTVELYHVTQWNLNALSSHLLWCGPLHLAFPSDVAMHAPIFNKWHKKKKKKNNNKKLTLHILTHGAMPRRGLTSLVVCIKDKNSWYKKEKCDNTEWGPLYTTVEKSTDRSRILAQDVVICGKGWYAREDEKTINYFTQVGVLRMSSFLSKALKMPKKLDLRRTPPSNKCRRVGNHVIFSSMYKVLHQRTHGRSVNRHRTRVSLSPNQILDFP